MAKLVIEKWQCDRCRLIADKEPRGNGRTHHRIIASVDYEVAGGSILEWKEMCGRCDNIVASELKAMLDHANADRAALTSQDKEAGR